MSLWVKKAKFNIILYAKDISKVNREKVKDERMNKNTLSKGK